MTIIRIRKDGIAEIKFKQNEYEVEVNDQLEIQKAFSDITKYGELSFHILVLPGRYGSITKEAREIEMFKSSVFMNQKSIAIVVVTLAQRILGKAYFSFKKHSPNYPVKFFEREKSAINWQMGLDKQNRQ